MLIFRLKMLQQANDKQEEETMKNVSCGAILVSTIDPIGRFIRLISGFDYNYSGLYFHSSAKKKTYVLLTTIYGLIEGTWINQKTSLQQLLSDPLVNKITIFPSIVPEDRFRENVILVTNTLKPISWERFARRLLNGIKSIELYDQLMKLFSKDVTHEQVTSLNKLISEYKMFDKPENININEKPSNVSDRAKEASLKAEEKLIQKLFQFYSSKPHYLDLLIDSIKRGKQNEKTLNLLGSYDEIVSGMVEELAKKGVKLSEQLLESLNELRNESSSLRGTTVMPIKMP